MFSVVIPLYNKGHTIVETVRSVLAQDFPDFELIVVDDGSTDGGPEKLEDSFDDPRIRLIRQENQGVSTARNRGVREAAFDLIAFLDGDDLWFPSYLARMKQSADEFPTAGMLCCAGYILHPDGSGFARHFASHGRKACEINYFDNPYFFGNSSCTVIRKSFFDRIGGFPVDMHHYEDHVFFHSLALETRVVFCPIPLNVVHKCFDGQASNDTTTAHVDHVNKTNIVYRRSVAVRNNAFVPYALFDLRCNILAHLLANDFAKVRLVLKLLDAGLLRRLNSFERLCYGTPALRSVAVSWIYLQKAVHRLKRRPRPIRHRNLVSQLPQAFVGRVAQTAATTAEIHGPSAGLSGLSV